MSLNEIGHSQHRRNDHWVLRLEIVRHADGKHLHRDDLAIPPAPRRAVHVRVVRDEERRELLYELARCGTTAAHDTWAVWERRDELGATRRREPRRAQVVVCGEITVELS